MPRTTVAGSLTKLVNRLMSERQEHLHAAAEIEKVFTRLGFNFNGAKEARKRQATKAVATHSANKVARRRKRRSYKQTAEEFIIGLLRARPLVTAQITDAWRKAGRGGKADNILGKLIAEKKVRREPVKDGRGSRYEPA
jgi:hypothetical protein